jgi:hypothetical protein
MKGEKRIMNIDNEKHVALYLTDWQMRMVRDVLGVDTHVWTVPVKGSGGFRYNGPMARRVEPVAKRMYLTEWQRKEVQDTIGEDCEFVELVGGIVVKYKAPPVAR